jgi:phospholipid/cholesterol/gamma-HCH transport system permease protein
MTEHDAIHYDSSSGQLICAGDWNLANLPALQQAFTTIRWPQQGDITVQGQDINVMDSAGAWLLREQQNQLQQQGLTLEFVDFSTEHQELIGIVSAKIAEIAPLPQTPVLPWLARIGKGSIDMFDSYCNFLAFIGHLAIEGGRILRSPKHIRWNALAAVIYRTGYQGLPIIALLSFMIGVVITFQMGLQLRSYGANIYIVDLLGLSILREFGPLLTAIMVAGRTGSAFAAQLGTMKINQEIDALNTLGVTPAELLLLPRIIGLLIALPLLTMWADVFGVIGGMVMSNSMLHITWHDFLHRFPNVIPLRSFLIGIGKAPVFALIIASIGCYQGMQVQENADSIGRNTTRSVVLAIFFIIVADALFSIIFSKLKL